MATFEQAARFALGDDEVKKLEVAGHEFNVKPLSQSWQNNTLVAHGQLSHHLTARPDDQIFYNIRITYGENLTVIVTNQLQAGGWGAMVVPVIEAFISTIPFVGGAIVVSGLAEPILTSVGREVATVVAGADWLAVAGGIVASIVAALLDAHPKATPTPPTPPPHENVPGEPCWCGEIHIPSGPGEIPR